MSLLAIVDHSALYTKIGVWVKKVQNLGSFSCGCEVSKLTAQSHKERTDSRSNTSIGYSHYTCYGTKNNVLNTYQNLLSNSQGLPVIAPLLGTEAL